MMKTAKRERITPDLSFYTRSAPNKQVLLHHNNRSSVHTVYAEATYKVGSKDAI